MSTFSHIPVLLNETIEGLNVSPGKKYIDATLGGGGHTGLILQYGGVVLGIDQDEEALEFVKKRFEESIKNKVLSVKKGNFRDIKKIANENGFEEVDGVLFDLGVSSHQLDKSQRGFSFRSEALDMRMDLSSKLTADDVVNKYSYERLVEIFLKYGEEHNSREIARQIVEERKKKPIKSALELTSLIERVSHRNEAINPATRVFQALRIEVNDELNSLKIGLEDGLGLLKHEGRICAISFHSLEDRIVKQTFEKWQRQRIGKTLTKKPTTATFEESKKNKRSRSAKLRVFEKI